MKYRFNGPALRAIRSNVIKAPMLNSLVVNTGQLQINSEDIAPIALEEVCLLINDLPSPKHSAYGKAAVESLLGVIEPIVSLTPSGKVFFPLTLRPHLIVANMYEKKKSPVILELINHGDAYLEKYDEDAIRCIQEAGKVAKNLANSFTPQSNSYLMWPVVTHHIIDRLLSLS